MPYFIYRVFPFRRLEKVDEAAAFAEASARAKALRASPDKPADCTIRVIFAATSRRPRSSCRRSARGRRAWPTMSESRREPAMAGAHG